MAKQLFRHVRTAIPVLFVAALLASAAGAQAQPSPQASDRPAAGQVPAGEGVDAEEQARRAANLAITQRRQAEKAAAAKAAAERAEAERVAADKAAADKAAQLAAQERAAAAKLAAEQQKKRADEAAVAADVQRVLQRAMQDYPVLATPAGQPLLRKIMDRQQALKAQGVYPSVAMVEAISDNLQVLAPRQKTQAQVVSSNSADAAQPRAIDGCRWVTPIKWACQ